MRKKDAKRADIIAALAKHVLANGLADTGLRRFAGVAGTSDRMLLYYFHNKDDLILAVLTHIAESLATTLDAAFAGGPLKPAPALRLLWRLIKSAEFADHVRLWLDLSSRASRGDPFYAAIVARMSAGWIAWMAALLDAPEHDRETLAALIIAAADGQLVLFPNAPARGDAAMDHLARVLDRP